MCAPVQWPVLVLGVEWGGSQVQALWVSMGSSGQESRDARARDVGARAVVCQRRPALISRHKPAGVHSCLCAPVSNY
ncbi:MAG: hypothetical protein J3K34DRAFT_421985 [Monoraphidium minutum]|nr:MAG: hypothetical protein J3K34DRAFT_421985 [Monoraphidium minutum]